MSYVNCISINLEEKKEQRRSAQVGAVFEGSKFLTSSPTLACLSYSSPSGYEEVSVVFICISLMTNVPFFFPLATLHSLWDLSFQTREPTEQPGSESAES